MKRRNDLSQPRRRRRLDVSYDADAFGNSMVNRDVAAPPHLCGKRSSSSSLLFNVAARRLAMTRGAVVLFC